MPFQDSIAGGIASIPDFYWVSQDVASLPEIRLLGGGFHNSSSFVRSPSRGGEGSEKGRDIAPDFVIL